MGKPKLFIDEDVHDKLAGVLRSCGIDAINAREVNRKGSSDEEQLRYAISQKRAIFSFNVVDYEKLAVKLFKEDKIHFGIIVSPQRGFGRTLDKLLNLLGETFADKLKNQLIYL